MKDGFDRLQLLDTYCPRINEADYEDVVVPRLTQENIRTHPFVHMRKIQYQGESGLLGTRLVDDVLGIRHGKQRAGYGSTIVDSH